MTRTAWLFVALVGAASPAVAAPTSLDWPAGPEATIAQQKCLICHGPEMIQSQRLSPAAWTKEVTKMTGWGAPLTPDEQKALAAYLAAHYALDTPAFVPGRLAL